MTSTMFAGTLSRLQLLQNTLLTSKTIHTKSAIPMSLRKPWLRATTKTSILESLKVNTPRFEQLRLVTSACRNYDKHDRTKQSLDTSKEAATSATLPQLDVPNYDKELMFKGLETDFPCLSRL